MSQCWSQDVFIRAWDFATVAHQGQSYGGPVEGQRIDYINHVGAVVMELIWALKPDDSRDGNLAIQCAILHDVVEDTQHTADDIAEHFGPSVAAGVLALTKNESLPTKAEQMQDSLERIKARPQEVWMVKLADRITNLSAPPAHWSMNKRMKYREEALVIYEALSEADAQLANRFQERLESYKRFIE